MSARAFQLVIAGYASALTLWLFGQVGIETMIGLMLLAFVAGCFFKTEAR